MLLEWNDSLQCATAVSGGEGSQPRGQVLQVIYKEFVSTGGCGFLIITNIFFQINTSESHREKTYNSYINEKETNMTL